MERATIVYCGQCHQPIVSGKGSGLVCFKVPGKDGYQFFHHRFHYDDCWESYLRGCSQQLARYTRR